VYFGSTKGVVIRFKDKLGDKGISFLDKLLLVGRYSLVGVIISSRDGLLFIARYSFNNRGISTSNVSLELFLTKLI